MTYLLKLLIRHQPDPMYDTLPNTGKQLLHIDGSDIPLVIIHPSLSEETQTNISEPQNDESLTENNVQIESEETNYSTTSRCQNINMAQPTISSTTPSRKRSKPKRLPQAVSLDDGGKYMHFGVEAAFADDSLGQVFQNANLLQYARLYNKSPNILPSSIRKKVRYKHLVGQ